MCICRLVLSDCKVIGSVNVTEISPEVKQQLHRLHGVYYNTASLFERAKIGREVIYSRRYSRATKRNSFAIEYVHNGTHKFGFVEYFLSLPSSTFIVVTPLLVHSSSSHTSPQHFYILNNFLISVTPQSCIDVIPTKAVLHKVIHVNTHSVSYVARLSHHLCYID